MSAAERFALKACPHCGNRRAVMNDRSTWYEVHCLGCGSTGPSGSQPYLAAERWNWRRRPKPLPSKVPT